MASTGKKVPRREIRKINEIKNEYLSKGYEVVVNPRAQDLPDFLYGHSPDLIARGAKDNVVVEIKSRDTLKESKQISQIAEVVKKHPNWSFELVVTNPRDADEKGTNEVVLTIREIEDRLNTVKELMTRKIYDATFLVAWSVLEAVLRIVAVEHINEKLEKETPLKLIKTLYSYGYVNAIELSSLERLNDVRNKLAHGFHAEKKYVREMGTLLNMIDRYLDEYVKDIDR